MKESIIMKLKPLQNRLHEKPNILKKLWITYPLKGISVII